MKKTERLILNSSCIFLATCLLLKTIIISIAGPFALRLRMDQPASNFYSFFHHRLHRYVLLPGYLAHGSCLWSICHTELNFGIPPERYLSYINGIFHIHKSCGLSESYSSLMTFKARAMDLCIRTPMTSNYGDATTRLMAWIALRVPQKYRWGSVACGRQGGGIKANS